MITFIELILIAAFPFILCHVILYTRACNEVYIAFEFNILRNFLLKEENFPSLIFCVRNLLNIEEHFMLNTELTLFPC